MKFWMGMAALLALPCTGAAAETIRWPAPWAAMPVLVYETESLDRESAPGGREATRSIDTTRIDVSAAREDGFRQRWSSLDASFEVLEGDRALEAPMRAAIETLSAHPIEVDLDRNGQYAGLHALPALAQRFRAAMRPVAQAGIDAQLAAPGAPARDDAAHAGAMAQVDAMLDRMASPEMVEAMLGRTLQTYNGFVGLELEPDQWYEMRAELPNPLGGPSFPATLQVLMTVSDADPDDVFLEWNRRIDPEKGAGALWALTEKLIGEPIPAAARKGLPREVDFHDEGLFLFRRGTGVIEMFETTRTVRLAGTEKVERQRMRLTGGDHAHAWAAETAGDDAEGDSARR